MLHRVDMAETTAATNYGGMRLTSLYISRCERIGQGVAAGSVSCYHTFMGPL